MTGHDYSEVREREKREKENMRMDVNRNVFGILWRCLVWFGQRTRLTRFCVWWFLKLFSLLLCFWFGRGICTKERKTKAN